MSNNVDLPFDIHAQHPYSQFAWITPEIARTLLALNERNRKVYPSVVQKWVKAIERGEWATNGEAIKISRDGKLLDGQHRLLAVLETGRPIYILVVLGLAPETQDTMDTGRNRTIVDVLSMEDGMQNAKGVSATAMLVQRYLCDNLPRDPRKDPTRQETKDFVLKHLDALVVAAKVGDQLRRSVQINNSVGGAAYFLTTSINCQAAEDFFASVSTGIGLEAGDPRLTLRNRAFAEAARKESRKKWDQDTQLASTAKAWNAWRTDKVIQVLSWKRNLEPFPRFM